MLAAGAESEPAMSAADIPISLIIVFSFLTAIAFFFSARSASRAFAVSVAAVRLAIALSACSIVSDFNALLAATFDLAIDEIEMLSVISLKPYYRFCHSV